MIKSLDDLLKVSGATSEGTVPRVTQFEADEQGVSTSWLYVAGDGDGDGEVGGGLLAKLVSAEDSLGQVARGVSCL